jgi:octaprenyl-diphosphate synthase
MPLSWDEPISDELRLVEDKIHQEVRSREELLTEISLHIIGSGGKRIRPGVALLSYHAVGGKDPEEIVSISAAFEIIHSATLIHDDINDGGDTRRGVVAAYRKYGVQQALIAGDFLFVRGFRLGGNLGQDLVDIIAEACTGMAESEILQSKYERNPFTPIDVYLRIIEGKTAMAIEAGARTGATLGGGDPVQVEALGEYGRNIGIAFQIIDDILDITGDESRLGKSRGMDFMEGKPTLPLILALSESNNGVRLRQLFSRESRTRDEVEEVIESLSQSDILERSREHARRFSTKAIEAISVIPDSEYKKALELLAERMIEREF